jgi:nucleoside-diphosphate-sugar epimerase
MLKVLRCRIPLPLASVHNRRSLIFRGNLVDVLTGCVRERQAAGQTYLASDGEDLSTPDLLRRMGKALDVRVCLWRFPPAMLRRIGTMAGQGGVVGRLIDSLQVDSSKVRTELGWRPPFTVDQGLAETAAWFRTI